MKHIENSFDYALPAIGEVSLSIVLGDGQKGSSSFKNFNGNYVIGAVSDVLLGNAENIKNKSLLISSLVSDVNPNTDLTSITYLINDAEAKSYSEEAESPNDSVYYTTTINFK